MTSLTSPEGVALEFPVAGPALRIVAYGIDLVLIWILVLVLVVIAVMIVMASATLTTWLAGWSERLSDVDAARPESLLLVLLPLVVVAMLISYFGELLYFVFWETVTDGRSPGKIAMRLRVMRQGGRPLDFRSSLIRNLLRLADSLPSQYAVGLVTMICSRETQRLGDHAAGTVVIRLDRAEAAHPIEIAPEVEPLPLSRAQLARIGASELALIRGTLRRAEAVEGTRGTRLLEQAKQSLVERLELASEQVPHDPRAFLQQLLATVEQALAR